MYNIIYNKYIYIYMYIYTQYIYIYILYVYIYIHIYTIYIYVSTQITYTCGDPEAGFGDGHICLSNMGSIKETHHSGQIFQ